MAENDDDDDDDDEAISFRWQKGLKSLAFFRELLRYLSSLFLSSQQYSLHIIGRLLDSNCGPIVSEVTLLFLPTVAQPLGSSHWSVNQI